MKFVTISDTHGKHNSLNLPWGEVIVHAGDVTAIGEETGVMDFLSWFQKLDFEYKIFIAGNHDFYFEKQSKEKIEQIIPKGIIYLNDSGATIDRFKIWGSPITPWFFNWAFNRYRGAPIRKHWDLIPLETDILITHGPVFGTLDTNKDGDHLGCEDLLNRVREVKPKVHVCGHIHEAYGTEDKEEIKFINASVLNEKYVLTNLPIVFEL